MGGKSPEWLRPWDAIKTYRYLRIGMIGAVVLLAASIIIERSEVDCWQTSISAYYYTPVQGVFVGTLIAVALALIIYKGGSAWEDVGLNFAGMFAPVVAFAPTTDAGTCWSIVPEPAPVVDGVLAGWVVADVENNIRALLTAGVLGLAAAAIIAMVVRRSVLAPIRHGERGTRISLAATALVLLLGWLLIETWSGFTAEAHGYAAVLMFVFLVGAIIVQVVEHRNEQDGVWFRVYAAVGTLMVVGAILIPTTRVFGDHTVFALQAYEIALFAVYWIAQTAENWNETVVGAAPATRE